MEFVGEYHRDKVLVLPENQRKQMDLPSWRDSVEVVNEIFGWVLKCGKETIECRSEDEARYIWALWSFNWNNFWVPKDDKYLAEILPRLLVLKEGHDEVVYEKTFFYSNRKIAEELKRLIYLTVTLRKGEENEKGENNEEEDEIVEDEVEDLSNEDL